MQDTKINIITEESIIVQLNFTNMQNKNDTRG